MRKFVDFYFSTLQVAFPHVYDTLTNFITVITSNIRRVSRQWTYWSFRYSWSIACRRCSNYISILDLTHGFYGLSKENCKRRWETSNFMDLVGLISEIWRYHCSYRCRGTHRGRPITRNCTGFKIRHVFSKCSLTTKDCLYDPVKFNSLRRSGMCQWTKSWWCSAPNHYFLIGPF